MELKALVKAGKTVNSGKITGTGAGDDAWFMEDAVAAKVLDFTDTGYPANYCLKPDLLKKVFDCLVTHLSRDRLDYMVLEVANDIFPEEPSHLLSADYFRDGVDGLLFVARNVIDALGRVTWLYHKGLYLLINGLLTFALLAMKDASLAAGLPILPLQQLSQESAIAPLNAPSFTFSARRIAS